MEVISSMVWKYSIYFLAVIGIIVLIYRSFIILDGFNTATERCPGKSVYDPVDKECRDPDCKPGQKSAYGPNGFICLNRDKSDKTYNPTKQSDCPSGTTFDETGKQCVVCTRLPNGITECRSAGNYSPSPFKQGSINEETEKTDVRDTAASITYSDWVTDSKTGGDLMSSGGQSSFLGTHRSSSGRFSTIDEEDKSDVYDDVEADYADMFKSRKYDFKNARSYGDDDDYEDEEDEDDYEDDEDDEYFDEEEDDEIAYKKFLERRRKYRKLLASKDNFEDYKKNRVYKRQFTLPKDEEEKKV